jgi:dihydrofolate synthase/folylpolyglutamate synthase
MFSYTDAIDYIYSLNKNRHIQLKFGFDRMKAVLSKLKDPQERLNIVHVAGTKGKGSTVSFLSSILRSKYNVGLFTSPSLINTAERISINGELISPKDFSSVIAFLKKTYSDLPGYSIPTTFESFSIAAFLYFYRQKVDLSVFEVGMGGRLDATNIIKKPTVSVITPISFDHQKFLGNTLYEIAGEKSGIIKRARPVVIGKQVREAKERLIKEAKIKHSDYFVYGKDFYASNFVEDLSGTTFDFFSTYFGVKIKNLHISLIGKHQAENASIAVQSALLLNELDFKVGINDIRLGLQKSFWPGRFEVISKEPLIVLDGAHNGASAGALYEAITQFNRKHTIFLFGVLKDKNIIDVVSRLSKNNEIFILTEVPFSGSRRLPVESLREYVRTYVPEENIIVEKDYRKAFLKAYKLLNKNDILCVTGSLYLVAAVRKMMNRFVFSGNIL